MKWLWAFKFPANECSMTLTWATEMEISLLRCKNSHHFIWRERMRIASVDAEALAFTLAVAWFILFQIWKKKYISFECDTAWTTHMPYPRPAVSLLMKYGVHCAQIAYTWCHRSLPFGHQQAVGLVCHWQRETVRNYSVLNSKTKANMTFKSQLKHCEWDKSFCAPHRIHIRAQNCPYEHFVCDLNWGYTAC